MASTRQLALALTRQQTGAITSKLCVRSLHTTFTRFNQSSTPPQGEGKNFAEALTDKFIGQVKRQHQYFNHKNNRQAAKNPTRCVQIDSLPNTATTEDVRKLAREAFVKGDEKIIEIVFARHYDLSFYGRCIVLMSSPEDASRFIEYGNKRTLGGNILRMTFNGGSTSGANSILNIVRKPELNSITDATSASGRSVIISGLPISMTIDNLVGYLRSRNFFPVEASPDNVLKLTTKSQSTVSKYLVKFDSESEAWRCVRVFHNTNYFFQRHQEDYKLQLSVAY